MDHCFLSVWRPKILEGITIFCPQLEYQTTWDVIINTRYTFEIENYLGSVQGSVFLVVQEKNSMTDERNIDGGVKNFQTNCITQDKFGQYVAGLHSLNNSAFVSQFEVL